MILSLSPKILSVYTPHLRLHPFSRRLQRMSMLNRIRYHIAPPIGGAIEFNWERFWQVEHWLQVLLVWVNHNQESILSNQPFAFFIYKFKVVVQLV